MPSRDRFRVHYVPELDSDRTACRRASLPLHCTAIWDHVTCRLCRAALAEDVAL